MLTVVSFSSSDWLALASVLIDIVAIVIGAFVAIWVVDEVQAKHDTDKVLKDYFASEVINLRSVYRDISRQVYSQHLLPREFKNKMTSLGIQVTDLSKHIESRFGIDSGLVKYQVEFNTIVSESETYQANYKKNKAITFPDEFIQEFTRFEDTSCSVFNNLLENIYGSR